MPILAQDNTPTTSQEQSATPQLEREDFLNDVRSTRCINQSCLSPEATIELPTVQEDISTQTIVIVGMTMLISISIVLILARLWGR